MTTDTSAYAKAPTITGDALSWLDDKWDDGDNFFMWLHYMDVHYPFTPTEEFLRKVGVEPLSKRRVADLNGKMQEDPDALDEEDVDDLLKLYDAEIRFCDHHINRVFAALRDRGIFEETIIVLTADHGEGFGEHGRFGHHPYLYDELLRVPLIVRAPSVDPGVVDQQVSLVDVGPTIYDLLGIDTPENVQGTSFEPLLHGKEKAEPVALVTAADGDMLACRTSKWKCFWRVEEGTVELYDLKNDPSESNDVSENHRNVVDEFVDEMEAYLDAAEMSEVALPEVSEDESVKQRLRDLGYSE